MERALKLVGFYAEGSGRKDDPYRLVLVDSNNDEHEANTPDELWRALWAIYSDASLPPAAIDVTEDVAVVREAAQSMAGDDQGIYDTIAEAASSFVETRYGPGFGALAEKAIRNGGKPVHRFLRKISR